MKGIARAVKCFAVALAAELCLAQMDYSQYVNPLIGSEGPFTGQAFGGGDIFVGGALPFGAAKVGIDTHESNLSYATLNGGWTPRGQVTAISMLHEGGTGGAPKYGLIPQMPLTTISEPVNILDNRTYWQTRMGEDVAAVGHFKTSLKSGVDIELSAGRHSGFMQYTFPQGEKHVLVDISHYLPNPTGGFEEQYFIDGEINVAKNGNEYSGYLTAMGGWNDELILYIINPRRYKASRYDPTLSGAPMTVYYCGEFENTPSEARLFRARNTDPNGRFHTFANGGIPNATFLGERTAAAGPLHDRIGAVFSFNDSMPQMVKSRVGFSWISAQKACSWKQEEVTSWNIGDMVQKATSEWNNDVFNKITVPTENANKTRLTLLYSHLYFTHLMPSERSGENPLGDSDEPFWDDFYTIWDIFRCTVTLYQLIQPSYYEGMIRSLIDIWRYEGFMPDGRSGNWNGKTQGGSNADNMLADAYVRGLRGSVNWTAGYQAMVKDAEVQPYNTFSPNDMLGSVKEGRAGLYDWIPLGYISNDRSTRTVSRTVEYSLNDFALAQVAAGEMPEDRKKYLRRSAGWQLIWNLNVTSQGFSGFLTPKLSNGKFNLTGFNSDGSFNASGYKPALCGGCESLDIAYEGVPWEYSFTIPHDMQTLIQFMGGSDMFERRLDHIFMPNTAEQDLGANGAGITTIMNIGNEPDFATPYLYHYLKKQAKSVNQTRALSDQFFKNAAYGIPGNSDAGALNSWQVWQMIGFYPIVTQPVFLIGAPWFSDINMTVNHDRTLRIMANDLGDDSFYVQRVRINGKEWNQNWFNHDLLMNEGGTIEFDMGSKMTMWETGPPPPSPGHVELKPF